MGNPTTIKNEPIQKVIQIDGLGNFITENMAEGSPMAMKNINGQLPGTLFGDNFSTTLRVPTLAGRWTQGIPVNDFDIYLQNTGYCKNYESNGKLNGVCEFRTGEDPNGFIFVSTKKLNRYQDGQLSYFLYTLSFDNLDNVNGDFEIFTGAIQRGLEIDGQFDKIKEGLVFGYIYDSINQKAKLVLRIYKDFAIVHEADILSDKFPGNPHNLHIFKINIGYLGVYPFELEVVDGENRKTDLVYSYNFEQNTTSVNDPNLAFGIFVKNNGNTANLGVKNGSFQFGNYTTFRNETDSSARRILTTYSNESISAGNAILSTYRIPEKTTMIKEINNLGVYTEIFRITQTNRLLNVTISGISIKPAKINIYFVEKTAQTGASYTKLNENYNILEIAKNANVGTVDLTNAILIKSFLFNAGNAPIKIYENMRDANFLLDANTIAVVQLINSATVTDFEYIFDTEDLF